MKSFKGWMAGLLALAGLAMFGGTASAAPMQAPALITPAAAQAEAGPAAAAACYHPFLHHPYYGWHRCYGWHPYRRYGWRPYRPIYRPWGYYHPWHRYGYGWRRW